MKAVQFENHIKKGEIAFVTLFRAAKDSAWSVHAYGDDHEPLAPRDYIELNEEGDRRLWADLDAAYAFVRKCGYTQKIEIDG